MNLNPRKPNRSRTRAGRRVTQQAAVTPTT